MTDNIEPPPDEGPPIEEPAAEPIPPADPAEPDGQETEARSSPTEFPQQPTGSEDEPEAKIPADEGGYIDDVARWVDQGGWRDLKARYSAIAMGQGAAAQSQSVVINDGARSASITKVLLTAERVEEQTRAFVSTDLFEIIFKALLDHRVVLLGGSDGDGRTTIAMRLISMICGPGAVGYLHAEAGTELSFALAVASDKNQVLAEDTGYYAYLGDTPISQGTLETLSGKVRQAGSYLVLLTDHHFGGGSQKPFAFDVLRPPLDRVLREHLALKLKDHPWNCQARCTPEMVEVYADRILADPLVVRQLETRMPVRDVVGLAEALAVDIHGDSGIVSIVARWRDRLLVLAREILTSAGDPDHGRLEPHAQAFRIAYALFDGQPLDDVFAAGRLLALDVLPQYEQRENNPPYLVFESAVGKLVHPKMTSDDPARWVDPTAPRRATLVDPQLVDAILEVAWHEYDSLRKPLLSWVNALAGDPLLRIHLRAAQIAGALAAFDFDTVYRELIGPWARRNVQHRQAAAHALGAALHNGAARRARMQVSDWARSPDWRLQDSAARAFGTPLGTEDPAAAITSLTMLGQRRELGQSNAVPIALGLLWLSGKTDEVMGALCEWGASSSENLRFHAARAMLLVASQRVVDDQAGWMCLSDLIAPDPVRQEQVVQLWQYALTGVQLHHRSWEPLRRWLASADDPDADPELLRLHQRLAVAILTAEPLRPRAAFYLGLWRNRYPDSRTLTSIIDELSPPSGGRPTRED
jgi:hypothetical protein